MPRLSLKYWTSLDCGDEKVLIEIEMSMCAHFSLNPFLSYYNISLSISAHQTIDRNEDNMFTEMNDLFHFIERYRDDKRF